jgi:hypothetical protein
MKSFLILLFGLLALSSVLVASKPSYSQYKQLSKSSLWSNKLIKGSIDFGLQRVLAILDEANEITANIDYALGEVYNGYSAQEGALTYYKFNLRADHILNKDYAIEISCLVTYNTKSKQRKLVGYSTGYVDRTSSHATEKFAELTRKEIAKPIIKTAVAKLAWIAGRTVEIEEGLAGLDVRVEEIRRVAKWSTKDANYYKLDLVLKRTGDEQLLETQAILRSDLPTKRLILLKKDLLIRRVEAGL